MPEIKGAHKEFALRIQEYRKANSLTGEQLGSIVGITKGAVNQWESGLTNPKRISARHMDNLVKHSGKTSKYWIDGIDTNEMPESISSEFGEHTQDVIKYVLDNAPDNASNKDIALLCQFLFNKTKKNRLITDQDFQDILDIFY
tara:strand:- start:2863 stop:3294 length:432 start_codon:yes stop_codon:yes gene_type:complete